MQFAKQLRNPVKRGEITCSVRVWQSPRVKVGGRYRLDEGYIVVEKVTPLGFSDITPQMARRSGFRSVSELLKTAVHGPGRNVYLIEFHYQH